MAARGGHKIFFGHTQCVHTPLVPKPVPTYDVLTPYIKHCIPPLHFEAVCLHRWRAGSRNSVTQRFKKDTFNKYRNSIKMPNFVNHTEFFWGKKAILITLMFFLASIFSHFNCNFCTFTLKFQQDRCQIQFSHAKSFQMSYWRSQLNNFEDFWPKTSSLRFETWMILRIFMTLLTKWLTIDIFTSLATFPKTILVLFTAKHKLDSLLIDGKCYNGRRRSSAVLRETEQKILRNLFL